MMDDGVVLLKADIPIERGDVITINKYGHAVPANAKYILAPTTPFKRWVRVHIQRKAPEVMLNPDYRGDAIGMAISSSEPDGKAMVTLTRYLNVKVSDK